MKTEVFTDKNNITAFKKIKLLILYVKNWYMIIPDKLNLISEIKYRTIQDQTFICRSKSTDINEVVAIVSDAEYPESFIQLNDDDVVLDLGANIGSFTIYCNSVNKNVNYKGYAFEPFSKNFEILKKNCKLNSVKKFSLLRTAVSNMNGTVYMDIDCLPDSVSIIDENKGTLPIKSTKLSTFCRLKKIKSVSLIKMDIEGSEYSLLEVDLQFLTNHVKRIIFEYHNLNSVYNKKWIVKKLSQNFKLTKIYDAEGYGVLYAENKKIFRS